MAVPCVSYSPFGTGRLAKTYSLLVNGRISRGQAQQYNTFQAYACVISVHITLAKSSGILSPKSRGKEVHSLLWKESQSDMSRDPGKGEELGQELALSQPVGLEIQGQADMD